MYAVQAQLEHYENGNCVTGWRRTRSLPTFWVDASSQEEATKKADEIVRATEFGSHSDILVYMSVQKVFINQGAA